MKKSLWTFMLFILLILLSVTGCNTSTGGDGKATKLEFKLGHVGPADSEHPWEKYALAFGEKIEEETDGLIKINTFPGSQLGADREMTESLQQGTMDIGLISTIAMGNFVSQFQVWDLPYIFPSDNEKVDLILEGPIGEQLAQYAKEKGLIILAYWENDWRMMSNSKRPIQTVDDLKGLKMRVVENKPSIDWFGERVGSIATPMAFSEVYTALQQGTIDGQDNGTILSYGSKFHEVQKYFSTTKHIYAPLAFVVSEKAWSQLSEETQEKMKQLAVELGREQRAYNREVAQKYLEEMEEMGIEISYLTDDELDTFRKSAQGTYEKLGSEIGQELIDMMLQARE